MGIHWREDLKRRWPVIVYADPYTIAEWERTMTEVLAHPLAAPPLRLLVDRRYCQAPTAHFVEYMGGFVRARGPEFCDASIAIVTSDSAGYGAARMTELRVGAEPVNCTIRVFREWTDAETWLERAASAIRSET